jgi:hypothetical protein
MHVGASAFFLGFLLRRADLKRSTSPLRPNNLPNPDTMTAWAISSRIPRITQRRALRTRKKAKRAAEERWRRRPPDDAIGYDIWRAD